MAIQTVTDAIRYVGVDDNTLALFENQYPVQPMGVSYNSYVILDEKIAVMDSVDARATEEWLSNVARVLEGRRPDYLVVTHMEPDHSGSLMQLAQKYPEMKIVGNAKTFTLIKQFFGTGALSEDRMLEVGERDTLSLGLHRLRFLLAPMVHWPEVMTAYEETEKILFSADAFGRFGSLERTARAPWVPQARRYYYNIIGKYGAQVQALLKKISALEIKTICPLHGPMLTEDLGGGAAGWRTVAIIYAIIGLLVNTLSVFSVKELPEGELVDTTDKKEIEQDEKYNLVQAAKLLAGNKYYMMICVTYILQQIYGAMISMGTYYATYILGNQNLFGVFSWAINIPLIIALVFTPTLVAKWNGMYKLNVMSYTLATISRALVAVAGYMGSGNVTLMLLFTAIAALGQGPWQGDMNAVIAACSEYTWLTKHKRVDGTMYSCTSLGVKLGGGLGTAITGWLLAASHFDSALTVQPDSCINMLKIMYLVIPFALDAIITFILSRMKVEEANEKLRAAV